MLPKYRVNMLKQNKYEKIFCKIKSAESSDRSKTFQKTKFIISIYLREQFHCIMMTNTFSL